MLLLPIIIILFVFFYLNKEYKKSSYYQITKQPYLSVRYNTGRYGEYLTYKHLKHLENNGAKFLFNVYLPKENGETTEIDVLMICSKGIFVFESKNYSGWIFGSESQKNWYQTLPAGRGRSHKEHFYNPVMQNRSHIKHLRFFLGEQVPVQSIIVFSNRCTLKNIQIKSNDISVINRYNVAPAVSAICNQTSVDLLSENRISELYNKLYPFTQVDEIAKAQHIVDIYHNLNNEPHYKNTPSDISKSVVSEPTTSIQPDDVSVDSIVDNEATKTPVNDTVETHLIETEKQTSQILKCPRCNGDLVLRSATRGVNVGNQFYGCSNYPKCKYIQNIR